MMGQSKVFVVKNTGEKWVTFAAPMLNVPKEGVAVVGVPEKKRDLVHADTMEVEYGRSYFDNAADAAGAIAGYMFGYADNDCTCEFVEIPDCLLAPRKGRFIRLAVIYENKMHEIEKMHAEEYLKRTAEKEFQSPDREQKLDILINHAFEFFREAEEYGILNIEVVPALAS